ncbi:hypothetical protein DV735_g2121, partial [Chaetothyriales sp. CBS 134920]
MSVDISWETITQGPDGEALAEKIRDFIDDKFQQVPLPRFIKSVQVHSFAFGQNGPQDEDVPPPAQSDLAAGRSNRQADVRAAQPPVGPVPQLRSSVSGPTHRVNELQAAQLTRSSSPGIPGGTSNFSYLHLPIAGRSGTQTPLAAVAGGGPLSPIGWHHDFLHSSLAQYVGNSNIVSGPATRAATQYDAADATTRPSTANTVGSPSDLESPSNPASPELLPFAYPPGEPPASDRLSQVSQDFREAESDVKASAVQASDMQVIARVQYSGDVRMTLTAEILLDYPSQSFVGIPLKLSITGMSFDGLAVLAYTRKRMHFCFLDRDDAQTVLGSQGGESGGFAGRSQSGGPSMSGPLREIHVESEIGRQESGKPVLKNVGKVEKFVLEQIRRIFEDEFIFPSFWTFLTPGQPVNPDQLQIALVNRFTTSTQVYATIAGRALDNNNALVLLQSDGHTLYYPASPPAPISPLGADCAIRLGGPGSTTNITVPHLAGARIYFSLDTPLTFFLNPGPALVEPSVTNPTDPNIHLDWGFCEFTFNHDQLYANISYVDFVSALPIALDLTTRNSGTRTVAGLAPNGLDKVCAALEAQHAADGQGWDRLVVKKADGSGRNLRALSPNLGLVGNPDLFKGYFEPYIDAVWSHYSSKPICIDTQAAFGKVSATVCHNRLEFDGNAFEKPSTADIFSCSTGPFATCQHAQTNAIIPRLAAALSRGTALKADEFPEPQSLYYSEPVVNHYARIVHEANLDGKGYAFPYDDVQPSGGADQSGEVHAGDPLVWTVSVG